MAGKHAGKVEDGKSGRLEEWEVGRPEDWVMLPIQHTRDSQSSILPIFPSSPFQLRWHYPNAILRKRIVGCLVDVEVGHDQFRRRVG